MARIEQKLSSMAQALSTLKEALELFYFYQEPSSTAERKAAVLLALRDSVVQRFEYCTDLFWKVLKIYLEDVERVTLTISSPAGIIRASVTAGIISEDEGEQCMDMIKNRNLTSHLYHSDVAQAIIAKIPGYYELQETILNSVNKRVKQLASD